MGTRHTELYVTIPAWVFLVIIPEYINWESQFSSCAQKLIKPSDKTIVATSVLFRKGGQV